MNSVATAIYGKLSAGTALTALLANGTASIWHLQPPDNEAMPYIIYNLQGGGDENQTPSRMKNLVYFIRGYGRKNTAAGSIDTQIDALLHGNSITVSGWTNFWLMRETDLELVENLPSGEKAYMQGGFYRIRLDS